MFEKDAEIYKDKSELPKRLRVEVCSICQLKCPVCYMRADEENAKNGCGFGYLKFEDFKKLLDENELENIEISNSGEIFLNPDLVKILEYADKKGVKVTADNGVNLNYITDEQAEALAKYHVISMTVSIDGTSQETYEKYRVGGDYGKVIENIKKIIFYRQKYSNGCPHITWKFIVFGHNEHEIEQAKIEAEKLGVAIKFATNWDENFSPVKNPQKVLEQTGLNSLTANASPVELLKQFENGEVDWFFCNDLWQPQINWDGQLLGCCANYKRNFGGNVFKDGLFETLNHPDFLYAKNMVTNKVAPNENIPCFDCEIFQDMQKHNVWLKSPRAKNEQ